MTNRDSIHNLSNLELAKRLIRYRDGTTWGSTGWCGDFPGIVDTRDKAIKLEVEWLSQSLRPTNDILAEAIEKIRNVAESTKGTFDPSNDTNRDSYLSGFSDALDIMINTLTDYLSKG